MNSFVAELKKEHKRFMKKQGAAARFRRVENNQLRNDDFYYTDAPKYAEKYYGETYRATTRYDNDWD